MEKDLHLKEKIVFINNVKRFNQITGMNENEIRYLFNEGVKYNAFCYR